MERDYAIRLRCVDGAWTGVLRGPEGETAFDDVRDLWRTLGMDPYPRLEELRRLAWTDSLTGLLNRGGMERAAERLLEEGAEGEALLLLDVDDLKRINDVWGHHRGDQALKTVARAALEAAELRGAAGRIGGDEFAVLLRGLKGKEELRTAGEALCRKVREAEPEMELSVSVGACWREAGRDYHWLLERADRALYRGKEQGKGGMKIYWPAPEKD